MLFVLLTAVAMLSYRGGSRINPTYPRYSFVHNFFSDLGLARSYSGEPNAGPGALFLVALTGAGSGLALFFVAFGGFFVHSVYARVAGVLGTLAGVFAGVCFIGVAWCPADRFMDWHVRFVLWAFQAFPVAVLLYVLAS
jgi:hypothetical membrane protein